MRHRFTKSRAGRVMLGAVLAGALSGAGASFARADGLSLDIEAGSGNPNAPTNAVTVAPGSTTTFNVYAVVTDTTNTPTADGLGGLFAAFDASSTTAGSLGSLTAQLIPQPNGVFNFGSPTVSTGGTPYTAFSDGTNTHVGTGPQTGTSATLSGDFNSASPTGWFFAAYLVNSGGTISSINNAGIHLTAGNGEYFPVGTLTFVAGSSNGTATVTGVGRTQVNNNMVAALWSENGVVETPATGAAITSDSLTITIGSSLPTEDLPGDTDQNGNVGFDDFSTLVAHYNQATTGGYTTGDFDNSGLVDFSDFSTLVANYGRSVSGVVVLPEPTSLGLLGIGSLFAMQRRFRKGINA